MDENKILTFPQNFHFGSSVAAFQVEGNSGVRKTDWDVFLKENPQIVRPNEKGPQWWIKGKAERDIEKMAGLGLKIQRMSIEWGRIEPEKGVINYNAIKRYREIIRKIRSLGMSPLVTLNHYTLPEWVAKEGSWEAQHIATYFAKYTSLMVAEFPEVTHWLTLNEPNIIVIMSYFSHYFPPQKNSFFAALKARNNMIETHRRAYHVIKKANPNARVGVAFAFRYDRPENHKDPFERWYTQAVNYLGELGYVDAMVSTSDFIGCNYYTGYFLNLDLTKYKVSIHMSSKRIPKTLIFGEMRTPDAYLSDYGWPIVPDFLLHILRRLHKAYKIPVIITENGIADHRDKYRSLYILTHLVAVWRALQEGINVEDYIHWSTVDNLEWIEGYSKEFGLLQCDPITGEKTLRKSAYLYKDIATSSQIDVKRLVNTYIESEHQREKATEMIGRLLKGELSHGILRKHQEPYEDIYS